MSDDDSNEELFRLLVLAKKNKRGSSATGVMMSDQLKQSMFHNVFFPAEDKEMEDDFHLRRCWRFIPDKDRALGDLSWVVFDFETTGLKPEYHEIIEIGAIRYVNGEKIEQYNTLVKPARDLPNTITKITGIRPKELEDKPSISEVWKDFLQFIDASVLIAHNAEFDAAFLRATCEKLNYSVDCPIYCTLKMARSILKTAKKRNLDALAEFYGLTFTDRHRSIGDAEVTAEVMKRMLGNLNEITLRELEKYGVKRCN